METICWQYTIRSSSECQNPATKYCPTFQCDNPPLSMTIKAEINATCPVHQLNAGIYNFGIFGESIKSGYTGRTKFRGKLFYFLWWGLKNLRFVFLVVCSSVVEDFRILSIYSLILLLLLLFAVILVQISNQVLSCGKTALPFLFLLSAWYSLLFLSEICRLAINFPSHIYIYI